MTDYSEYTHEQLAQAADALRDEGATVASTERLDEIAAEIRAIDEVARNRPQNITGSGGI